MKKGQEVGLDRMKANGADLQAAGAPLPPRMRRDYVAFEDLTRPGARTYGFYLVYVSNSDYSQLIRASHPTAARIARSRTQYGEAELSFLDPIETPALD
ncbi:MAG TPA: hypothetical protein VJB57_11245 [Dehalococcoidia bacterium]|nr:hypothetical protein [Dehalococcoidia bacterium]